MPRFGRTCCCRWVIAGLLLAALPVHAQDGAADLVRKVRALGQAEQPAMVKDILPLLPHLRVEVRREAANALGQALFTVPRTGDTPPPPELATASRALLARLGIEPDPITRGVVAETLGRLPHRAPAAMREVEEALRVRLQDAHPAVVAGAAKGLDALIRNSGKVQPPEAATISQLARRGHACLRSRGRRLRAGAPARLARAGCRRSRGHRHAGTRLRRSGPAGAPARNPCVCND